MYFWRQISCLETDYSRVETKVFNYSIVYEAMEKSDHPYSTIG